MSPTGVLTLAALTLAFGDSLTLGQRLVYIMKNVDANLCLTIPEKGFGRLVPCVFMEKKDGNLTDELRDQIVMPMLVEESDVVDHDNDTQAAKPLPGLKTNGTKLTTPSPKHSGVNLTTTPTPAAAAPSYFLRLSRRKCLFVTNAGLLASGRCTNAAKFTVTSPAISHNISVKDAGAENTIGYKIQQRLSCIVAETAKNATVPVVKSCLVGVNTTTASKGGHKITVTNAPRLHQFWYFCNVFGQCLEAPDLSSRITDVHITTGSPSDMTTTPPEEYYHTHPSAAPAISTTPRSKTSTAGNFATTGTGEAHLPFIWLLLLHGAAFLLLPSL